MRERSWEERKKKGMLTDKKNDDRNKTKARWIQEAKTKWQNRKENDKSERKQENTNE